MHGELRQVPRRACMDPAPPRKRRIDASSSIFRQVRGVVADRKAFHDDPDAAKHKLARWQSSQRKASAPFAASSANASISWQDLEGLGRPRVSNGRVAAFVAENFGLTVTAISRLTGERDLNFRATAGGRSYVIKVANASESRAQLECEHAAMLHVARHATTRQKRHSRHLGSADEPPENNGSFERGSELF